jgi:hypothetical protein
MPNQKIDEQTREQIMEFLPDAIKKACGSYMAFMQKESVGEGKTTDKDFIDHHNACKAAIAHIQLLLKLSEWAGLRENIENNEDYISLMKSARAEVDAYRSQQKDLA